MAGSSAVLLALVVLMGAAINELSKCKNHCIRNEGYTVLFVIAQALQNKHFLSNRQQIRRAAP